MRLEIGSRLPDFDERFKGRRVLSKSAVGLKSGLLNYPNPESWATPALSKRDARPATSHYARFYRRGPRPENRTVGSSIAAALTPRPIGIGDCREGGMRGLRGRAARARAAARLLRRVPCGERHTVKNLSGALRQQQILGDRQIGWKRSSSRV